MSSEVRRAIAVSVAVSALVASSDATAECTKDSECKGARICDKGMCVDPPASPASSSPACRVDSDCAGDDVCADRRCVSHGRARAPAIPVAPAPPPAPPPVALVPVTVLDTSGRVTVTVSPSAGGQVAPCTAPCVLQVPVGSAYVDARHGDQGFGSNVQITGPSTMKVELRRGYGAPIFLTVFGGIGFFVGLGLLGANGFSTSCNDGDPSCNATVGTAGAVAMAIGGVFAISGGIAFAFVGKNKIDVTPGGATAVAGRLRLGALPSAGGAKAGVAMSF